MATDRWKRLRACTGGWGVSMRMAERISSSQTRAMLLVHDARVTTPLQHTSRDTSQTVFTKAENPIIYWAWSQAFSRARQESEEMALPGMGAPSKLIWRATRPWRNGNRPCGCAALARRQCARR